MTTHEVIEFVGAIGNLGVLIWFFFVAHKVEKIDKRLQALEAKASE